MKLTGELKEQVEKTDSMDEKKRLIEEAGIRNRAKTCEVYAFDEMTRGYGNDANRDKNADKYLRKAFEIAKTYKVAR